MLRNTASKGETKAERTELRWSLIGPAANHADELSIGINHIRVINEMLHKQAECPWKMDLLPTDSSPNSGTSKEGRYALKLMKQ